MSSGRKLKTVLEPSGLYYPNRIAKALFDAMDDVMGPNGLNSLLKIAHLEAYGDTLPLDNLERAFDFSDISAINQALEEMYGAHGGRGISLRIGQSAFAQGLKGFGAMRAINDPAFQALPLDKRIHYGLRGLASILTNFSDQTSHVENQESTLLFVSDRSPYSWGRQSDKPTCHMMVGMILECLRWSSNGYIFYVRETECIAKGNHQCVFRVNKSAIGERI